MTRAKEISKVITAPVLSGLTYPTTDGSANQFMKTDGSGTLSFATVTGTTINNNADNRIITGSGSANTLEGESNLTFDGTTLGLTGNLTVSGAFTSQGIDDNADATAITITSDEKVGIGASPTQLLDVVGSSANIRVAESGGGDLRMNVSGSTGGIGTHSNHPLIFRTNSGEQARIHPSGHFFINTSAPDITSTLVVSGNQSADVATFMYNGNSGTFLDINCETANGSIILTADARSGNYPPLTFKTGNAERLRIDSSGNIGISTSSPNSKLQVNGHIRAENSAFRGGREDASAPTHSFHDDNDTGMFNIASNILAFSTGGSERMRIDSSGRVGINNTNPNSAMLHADQTASNEQGIFIHPEHSSYTNIGLLIQTIRAGSNVFGMMQCKVSSGGDMIFNLRGDGNAFADNNWNAGGADYAEYFEWKDGNTNSEDRRGYTVVLDGNQIRKSTSDDAQATIIGVVSATPAMVGDNAFDRWIGKYEKDEYGNCIYEEHTVTEWKDGNKTKSYDTDKIPSDVTVPDDAVVKTYHVDENDKNTSEKFTRKKESSSYDASKKYIPREERKEWEIIGLVGKLRIRVGQTIGDRWIKMREISDTVHEYLVR